MAGPAPTVQKRKAAGLSRFAFGFADAGQRFAGRVQHTRRGCGTGAETDQALRQTRLQQQSYQVVRHKHTALLVNSSSSVTCTLAT